MPQAHITSSLHSTDGLFRTGDVLHFGRVNCKPAQGHEHSCCSLEEFAAIILVPKGPWFTAELWVQVLRSMLKAKKKGGHGVALPLSKASGRSDAVTATLGFNWQQEEVGINSSTGSKSPQDLNVI